MRRAGVLPNTFVAQPRPRLVAAVNLPAAYSWIEGTPITMGDNDLYGDCTCCAAWNAGYIKAMRAGVKMPVSEDGPFELYKTLGGMPADIGLDPATVFEYWQKNPINGFVLKGIWSLALDDFDGMESAIIDEGFVYLTAMLDKGQLSQGNWTTIPGDVEDGVHAFLGTGVVGSRFTDDTWGMELSFEKAWFAAQGVNAWRCELEAA